ncbi:MAG: hypothetical protein Q9164_004753 [Protoblastenia rupestris]
MRFDYEICIVLLACNFAREAGALAVSSLPASLPLNPKTRQNPSQPSILQKNLTAVNLNALSPTFKANIDRTISIVKASWDSIELNGLNATPVPDGPTTDPDRLKRIVLYFSKGTTCIYIPSQEEHWGTWGLPQPCIREWEPDTIPWSPQYMDVVEANQILQSSQFATPWTAVTLGHRDTTWKVPLYLRMGRVYYEFHYRTGIPSRPGVVAVDMLDGEIRTPPESP